MECPGLPLIIIHYLFDDVVCKNNLSIKEN